MSIIESKSQFQLIIERERSRSDRMGHDFSLIVYDIPQQKSGYDQAAITHLILRRIRLYDEIGVFENGRIMVLMPYTGYEQARTVAEAIRMNITPGEFPLQYSIFTYPGQWSGGPQEQRCESVTVWGEIIRQFRGASCSGLPAWKRCMDVLCACNGLLILSPVLLVLAAFIKAVSPGPVFFRQARIGYLGRQFQCLKFRTMHLEAGSALHTEHLSNLIRGDAPLQKLDSEDPRIIPCGRIIRMTGLDELPQLLNVLFGDMSLIGPRPCIAYEAREFKPWQHRRFDAVPGITGLWQVNGKNRTTFTEMIRYDIRYALRKSFIMDFIILFKTVPAIIAQVTDQRKIRLRGELQ